MKNSPIIIVAGDPRSVFLEIFFKSIKYKNYKSPIILICSKKILLHHMKKNKVKKKINILDYKEIKTLNLDNKSINLIDIRLEKNNSNKYIHQSFELAFYLVKNKFSYKFINGPINKKSFLQKKFLGITEFISHRFKSKNMGMLIYNKNLSVSPITTHVPIKLVTKYISKKIIENKIKIIDEFYRSTLKYKPKIGVTGLNPHCESVSTFSEEDKIITPAIRSQKKRGVDVKGPFSADTIFLKKNRKKFNVIIGMYHDQVLTPIKTIFEFDAINITMGLPFMRLSPDHGPNEKMVGKKISNPLSLVRAIEFLDSK